MLLRRSLVLLAALGSVVTSLELALMRHWDGALQLVPWPAIAALAIGVLLVLGHPGRRRIQAARLIAVGVLVVAAVGVAIHVWANYDAGVLDARYTLTWAAKGELERWLLAATDAVGPTPVMAPAALGFMALALSFSTLRHPALSGTR